MKAFGLLLLLFCVGCAGRTPSSTKSYQSTYWPESDTNSQADGAAFTASGMHFRKPMPTRPDWKPLEFYFKHCSEIGSETFYSKTSYACTGP